jgi:hypothetical protein
MPHKPFNLIIILIAFALGGCATTPPPDPRILDNARAAIDQAEAAGANEYAPLELRFAEERLSAARFELERNKVTEARRLADEAEIEAQLALARTQAALTRADLAQRQRDLEQLKADLTEAFGEEVLQP